MDRFLRDQRVALYATAIGIISFLVGNTLHGLDFPYMPIPFSFNVLGTASMSLCLVYLVVRNRGDRFAFGSVLVGVTLFSLSKASELPQVREAVSSRYGRIASDFYNSVITYSLMDVGYCVVGLALCTLFISVSRRMHETADRERRLRLSEERFRGIFDHSNDAILLASAGGLNILDANTRAQDLFAKPKAELMRLSLGTLYPGAAAEAWSLGDGDSSVGAGVTELSYDLPDGIVRTTEVSVSGINLFDQPCLVVLVRDVSDRKRIEQERLDLERKLLEAQRLESLGLLAGGVAHDFNNLLTGIMGHTDLALTCVPESSEARMFLERIEKSTERAAELANQMLAYSGRGKFRNHTIDLNHLITEMGSLLAASFPKKVQVVYDLANPLPHLVGDSTQIRQVLMNLLINAGEAIGDREGTITITSRTLRPDEIDTLGSHLLGEQLPLRWIKIEICDDGCGMDELTCEKIFDPFFTTKFTGRGLGLAAVHGIIRGHGGTINVSSYPGKGTRFEVRLPAGAGAQDSAGYTSLNEVGKAVSLVVPVLRLGEPPTILAVDDEAEVRDLMRDVLEGCGYRVLTAEDGNRAIEIFRQESERIAVVVLDLSMPKLDGPEAFSTLRSIRPDIRVIVSSGYSESEISDRFNACLLAGFIHKPYRPEALVETVQRVLSD